MRVVAGRYVLLGELGRGGMGVVWRARDEVIGREIALKELRMPPGLGTAEQSTFLDRVLREARTAGALNDPGVVTVHDIVSDDGATYIAMELVQAPTLSELVSRNGPLSADAAREIALSALSALDTAHEAGIVHRDVKPSNLMVLPNGRVKLADFGIARAKDDPALTASGGMMGSPGYLAPELFRGAPPDRASDLWALGATLFYAVEGRAPFERDSTAATLHAIMYDYPRLQRCTGPLAEAIMGLLNQAASSRLTGAAFRRLLDGTPASAPDDVMTHLVRAGTADPATSLVAPGSTLPETPWQHAEPPLVAPAAPSWADEWPAPRKPFPVKPVLAVAATVLVVAAIGTVLFAVNRTGPVQVANTRELSSAAPPAGSSSLAPSTSDTALTSVPTSASSTVSAAPAVSATAAPRTPAAATRTVIRVPPPPPAPTGSVSAADPARKFLVLRRYYNAGKGWFVTLAEGDPVPAGYAPDMVLGSALAKPETGTISLYSCETTLAQLPQGPWTGGPFSSVDQTGRCEGERTVRLVGYIFVHAPAGIRSTRLYRCSSEGYHRGDVPAADCNGASSEGPLGFVVNP